MTEQAMLEQIGRLDDLERQGITSLVEALLADNPLAVAIVNMLGEVPWSGKPKPLPPPQVNGQGPMPTPKPSGPGIPMTGGAHTVEAQTGPDEFSIDTGREYSLSGRVSVEGDLLDIVFKRGDGQPFSGGNEEFSLTISIDDDLT